MKACNPELVVEENVGSMLPVHGQDQKHKLETFLRARELRKWIKENPGKLSTEMPEHLRGYISFLQRKKLVKVKGNGNRQHVYFVREIEEIQ